MLSLVQKLLLLYILGYFISQIRLYLLNFSLEKLLFNGKNYYFPKSTRCDQSPLIYFRYSKGLIINPPIISGYSVCGIQGRKYAIWAQYKTALKSTRRITRNPGHNVNMFEKFTIRVGYGRGPLLRTFGNNIGH